MLGQKYVKEKVRFLEDLKTPKNHYEINWPVKGNENVNHDYSSDNIELSNTDGSHSILRLEVLKYSQYGHSKSEKDCRVGERRYFNWCR